MLIHLFFDDCNPMVYCRSSRLCHDWLLQRYRKKGLLYEYERKDCILLDYCGIYIFIMNARHSIQGYSFKLRFISLYVVFIFFNTFITLLSISYFPFRHALILKINLKMNIFIFFLITLSTKLPLAFNFPKILKAV